MNKIFEGNVYLTFEFGWYHFYCVHASKYKIIVNDETKLENATICVDDKLPNAITVEGLETYKAGIKRDKPVDRKKIVNGNFMIHFIN